VRSGPGAAWTILLFHTISARPSKLPRMVGSTLGVYGFGLIFVSARTNERYHHHTASADCDGGRADDYFQEKDEGPQSESRTAIIRKK
jgi:hypothetical protein